MNSLTVEKFFRTRFRMSQIRLIAAIDDLKQLRRVAENLHVTPPAVSKQIAEMEGDLEQKILRRVGNRVEFTPTGLLLARHAHQMLEQLERTRIELTELLAGAAEQIGIGAVPTVAPFFLPAIVRDLRARFPGTTIRLREGRFAELAPLLADGTLNIILARDTEHRLAPNFKQRVVMQDPLAVVCGPGHTLATRRNVQWRDVDGLPWILPVHGSSTAILLEQIFEANAVRPGRGSIESISLAVNISLLRANNMLGVVPTAYARDYVKGGLVNVLPLSIATLQAEIKAVWRIDDAGPTTELLLKLAQQHARVV